ncbi:MAG: YqaA family protein [Rubrivivax sp.]|nr:YqaA family protein [Rubrivivax sp.]
MFEWISQAAAWLQSWMSPEAGLWGLFFSAFVSATILPGSSEVVMTALVTAYPHLAWWSLLVALCGNLTGAVLTFGMGLAGRQGYERFQRVRIDESSRLVQRLKRVGPPALVLSVLPLVGDALVLAAGWFRMPFWPSVFWIAVGKGLRYLLLVLGLLGVLSFGA